MNSLGFGLERIVIPIFRYPKIAAAVFVALLAIAAYGGTQLSFDQNLRGAFAGNSETYQEYIQAVGDFVDPENEVLVLVEGDTLGSPENFTKLRDLQFELQFVDGVANVSSAFALRNPPDEQGDASLVIADTENGLTPEILQGVRDHPLYGHKLLSADGDAMIFVMTPNEAQAPIGTTRIIRNAIHEIVDTTLADSDLTVTVSGFPTLRLDIVDVLIRDQVVLNAAGVIVGIIMSLIVFRSVIAAVMTALPAIVAGGMVLGLIGLSGTQITVMSNVVPALIMVLGYADAMHLTYAWRRKRAEGADYSEAERYAQLSVGPACMLTAITTALAFISLTLSDVEIVSKFAWIGAVGAILGGLVVLALHTLLALYLGRYWNPTKGHGQSLLAKMREPSAGVGRFSVRHAKLITLIALPLFVALIFMHFSVPPQHALREHLPSNNPANAALGRIDQKFDGLYPLQILVPLGDVSPESPEGLARIKAVSDAVAALPETDTPLSLWSVAKWLGGDDPDEAATRLQRLTEEFPQATARFGSGNTTLVTTTIHEMTTQATKPVIARVEAAAQEAGGPDVAVTGMTVLMAIESDRTINNLFWSLSLAVISGVFAIMLAFRSWRVGVIALLPNAMPILATGSLLYLTGHGMQFTSVLSLTVAFGIAVDDTVHYLNRYRNISRSIDDLGERLVDTSRHIGPVLVGTTAILIAGLATTLVSGMPTIRLFGELAGVTLAAALIGDMLVLPALMAGLAKSWFKPKDSLTRHKYPLDAPADA